jgi:DNA polymerase
MSNKFIEFQNQVEELKTRYAQGEISEAKRDELIRKLKLQDERWGDAWMLSPEGEWFRKAKGSKDWIRDYPIDLIEPPVVPVREMKDLHQVARAIHDCTRCSLHLERTRVVPGEGPVKSNIMLIGEGPGYHEDKQGRPFVGASGQFLEELLNSIGYKRGDVFIANVVKCRPPGNRDPQLDELEACKDYLDRQIELVDPKVIITLGRYSMNRYFPGASITKIHGQPQRIGNRLIVPMFHPAAALHQPRWRTMIEEDFKKLPQFIAEALAASQAENKGFDPDNAKQLNLF